MTQQSLITRLKAVEEALAMFNSKVKPVVNGADDSCFIIGMREQVTDRQMQAACEALSDLRELIKEAEGQEQAGVHAGKPTYTALGEKPAVAEQQQAKEKQ